MQLACRRPEIRKKEIKEVKGEKVNCSKWQFKKIASDIFRNAVEIIQNIGREVILAICVRILRQRVVRGMYISRERLALTLEGKKGRWISQVFKWIYGY